MSQLGELRAAPQAVIANGDSLSGAVDVGDGGMVALQMPSSWTTANLTFQASIDNSTFNNVYDGSGTELEITAAASRYIVLPPTTFAGMRWVKIRSGTSGSAVAQGGARTIKIAVRKLA